MEAQKTTVTDPAAVQTNTEPAAKTEPAAAGGPKEGTAAAAAGAAGVKTYDQAYVDELIAKNKAAQEAAVQEALKVAGMDKDAKAQYEKEQAEKKLTDREADIARRELKADAREILSKKDVPTEFLDMLLGKDLQETRKNVDSFAAAFDRAVQAQVEKRLVGKTPSGGNGTGMSSVEAMAAEIDKYL